MKQGVCVGTVTLALGAGGIARVARMCVRALIEDEEELSLISFLDSDPAVVGGFNAKTCNGRKLLFAIRIHTEALTRTTFLYDTIGLARAHPRLPIINRANAVWIHGLEAWEGMRVDYRRTIERAQLVLANSHYTLQRYQNNHGLLPTGRVCWLATEQDKPPETIATFAGPPTVLIVGRIEATEGRKGHAELLACWPRVVSAVPGARLVIVGGGTGLGIVRQQARDSPAAANIDVLGFVPEPDLPKLYARAHVFAMPSRQEGFGIAYVEALRHGLPVIASLQDAGQEINVDGETGFNVDLERREELEERLIHLLRDTDRAAAFGKAGHSRWQRHFRYSSFAKRFLEHWLDFRKHG